MPVCMERRVHLALAFLTGLAGMCLPNTEGHSTFLKGLECPST